MRLATLWHDGRSIAARVQDDGFVEIDGHADLGSLLEEQDWERIAASAGTPVQSLRDVGWLPPVPSPGKIICAGLNYRAHIEEMGRPLPAYPTLFAKFADTLTGPYDDIETVAEDPQLDWEGELAVVIGKTAHRIGEEEAGAHIAGYAVANDISMRGWQNRTNEWLQGKIWARSTPLGPVLATPDELDVATAMLRTTVNGEIVQEHAIADLVFTPEQLVAYASTMIPLRPGDVILTGTPGGVGHARRPQRYLHEGDTVEVAIDGLGAATNRIVDHGERALLGS